MILTIVLRALAQLAHDYVTVAVPCFKIFSLEVTTVAYTSLPETFTRLHSCTRFETCSG